MPTPPSPEHGLLGLASATRVKRTASLHALHVLEYALAAPAPRRHRTWVHRVMIAVDALRRALSEQLDNGGASAGLLRDLAVNEPAYAQRVQRLQQEQMDLSIALASLQEQIEPDPELDIDPAEIRTRLADIARRFREHRAHEADLIYESTGIDLEVPEQSDLTRRAGNPRTTGTAPPAES